MHTLILADAIDIINFLYCPKLSPDFNGKGLKLTTEGRVLKEVSES